MCWLILNSDKVSLFISFLKLRKFEKRSIGENVKLYISFFDVEAKEFNYSLPARNLSEYTLKKSFNSAKVRPIFFVCDIYFPTAHCKKVDKVLQKSIMGVELSGRISVDLNYPTLRKRTRPP